MAKAVVMQVTDIKNKRQDMNTRQHLLIAADAFRPLRRASRLLPKTWLALVFVSCLALFCLPAYAVPEQQDALQQPLKADPQQGRQPAGTEDSAPQPPQNDAPPKSGVDDQGRAAWRELEKGLLFGEFQLNDGYARLTVLRIDPAFFEFTLCARSQDSGPSRPLSQWGEQYNLSAAINASMYLPDGSTSTGYMRQGAHTNNGRIVQRFGAFFVAGPDEPGLPLAAILDRDNPLWRQEMDRYSLVIQNYRMINADRRILWSPGGPHYSISAVAQDGDGQILFMHCRQPVEAYSFAQQVLHLPLNVRTVMYVEGGGQAGLLVRSAALTQELVGLSPSGLLVTGDLRAVLPNVLGARRKGAPAAAPQAEIPAASAPDQDSPARGATEQSPQADQTPQTPAETQQGDTAAQPQSGAEDAAKPADAAQPQKEKQPANAAPDQKPYQKPDQAQDPAASVAPQEGEQKAATTPAGAETAPLTEPGTSLVQPSSDATSVEQKGDN